jgi:hypothetical protein
MRHYVGLAPLLIVGLIAVLQPSRGNAQPLSFHAGGNRVFGCPPLATLSLNGTGPTQQGDCTTYEVYSVIPAVPLEAWLAAQLGPTGAHRPQNETLQKQVDELTARVQALEAALQKLRGQAPSPPPGAR